MKKILLLTAGLLSGALAFGQSLEGRWAGSVSKMETSGDDLLQMTSDYVLTFSGDAFSLQVDRTVDLGITDVPPFQIVASVSGTWQRDGDLLTLVPAKRPGPEAGLKADGMPGLLRVLLARPLRKDLVKTLQQQERFEILILTDTAMTIKEQPAAKDLRNPEYEPVILSMERK